MDLLSRAEALLGQIQAEIERNGVSQTSPGVHVHPPNAGASAGSGSGSGSGSRAEQELVHKARETVEALTAQIQSSAAAADESKLERLLGLCDQLNGGIDTLASRVSRRTRLRGLGLKVDGLQGASTGVEVAVGVGVGGHGEPTVREDEENVPLTPRVDKGKGRAEPEPVEPEKVLSPTFAITESEDEDEDDHRYVDVEEGDEVGLQVASPTDRFVARHDSLAVSCMRMRMLTFVFLFAFGTIGQRAGSRKRGRYSARARCCSGQKRWRGNTRAKTFDARYVFCLRISISTTPTPPKRPKLTIPHYTHSFWKRWSSAHLRAALSTTLEWTLEVRSRTTRRRLRPRPCRPRPHLRRRGRTSRRARRHRRLCRHRRHRRGLELGGRFRF